VISIFAIVNPFGILPVLVSLTSDLEPAPRTRLLRTASVAAFMILAIMAVAGDFLLRTVFHIHLEEFAFGGGLMLIVVGIHNLLGRGGVEANHAASGPREAGVNYSERIALAVSPIACPLLVGPGAIVTVMLIVNRSGVGFGLGASLVAFLFVVLVMQSANAAFRLLGPVILMAIGRVMQIFIVAIGVHFVFTSLAQMFPTLGK